jgi:hypothetical protein
MAFRVFPKTVTPKWNWDWPHLVHVQRALARMTRGLCNRLIILISPSLR